MSELWFKRKRYGWGWTPVSWQGWAIVAGYVAILVGGALMLLGDDVTALEVLIYVAAVVLSTIALVRICLAKGETPRWQWGDRGDG